MGSERKTMATKEGKRYVLESLRNAKQFLKDSETLIREGSYAHAAALAALGIEESVKAKIVTRHLWWDGRFEVDTKTYREEIKNHFSKLSQAGVDHAIASLRPRLMPEDSISLQELHQRLKYLLDKEDEFLGNLEVERILYSALAFLKEKWLYVDTEDGKVTTPLSWNKEDAKKVLAMAQKRLHEYEADIMQDLQEHTKRFARGKTLETLSSQEPIP